MKMVVLLKSHFLKFVIFPDNTETVIKNLIAKLEATSSVLNVPTPACFRPGRSTEHIAAVNHDIKEDANLSIIRCSHQLGLFKTTTWQNFREDLALKLYKVQPMQELTSP